MSSVAETPFRPRIPNRFTEKNGFVTATKLGTTNKFFVAATKNFAAATKRFVDRTKPFCCCNKIFLLSPF